MSRASKSYVYERPEYDLKLEEVANGVQVTQHWRTYLARKWRLSSEVIKVVENALLHGVTAFWQHGHPSKSESHHISFSFDHRPASWLFAIGSPSCPPSLRCITFNKHLKEYFKANGLGYYWQWETSGGQNINIQPQDLSSILTILPLSDIRDGKLPVFVRDARSEAPSQFYRFEADLENDIHSRLLQSPISPIEIQRQRSFAANDTFEPDSRPDIILLQPEIVLILELKLHIAGEVELSQLLRYLNNNSLKTMFCKRPVHGILIAERFDNSAISSARIHSNVTFIAYSQKNDGMLTFETVLGIDLLSNHFCS